MGDSEDEYNNSGSHLNSGVTSNGGTNNSNSNYNNPNNKKPNRDKFYRERDNDSYNNRNNDNRRDWNNDRRGGNDWKGRGGGMNPSSHMISPGGGYNSGYQRGMGNSDYSRKYTSHQTSPSGNYDSSPPPYKRKKDWEGGDNRLPSGHSGGGYHGQHGGGGGYNKPHSDYNKQAQQAEPDYPTQPPCLSFKQFLQQQDDNISDEEAIKRYNEYKLDFKKTQINNFFLEHKEEEWFKSRYHPDENFKRRNEQNQHVLNRLEVFMELMNNGWLENVSAEADKSKEIVRFLDAVVIKLEGGSEQDIKQLDGVNGSEVEPVKESIKSEEPKGEADSPQDADDGEVKNGEPAPKKRKSEDSGSESGAYTDSDSASNSEGEEGGVKEAKPKKKKSKKDPSLAKQGPKQLHKTASIFMRNLAPSVTKQDLENLCKEYEGFKRVALSDPAPERGFFRRGWITFEPQIDVKKICWNLQNIKVKDVNPAAIVNRELTSRIRPASSLVSHHKSVIKNDIKIAMKIVQNMDRKWNLWQEKSLEEEEIEEEPLPVKDTSADQQAQDENGEIAALEKTAFSKIPSNGPKYLPHKYNSLNPLLNNITDYLVDEMSAEEEELLGGDGTAKPNSSNSLEIDIDRNYCKALDRILLYLRVVHSFDYYNAVEYQQEDSMPNRCGIMFVRPALPLNAASASLKTTQDEINQYTQQTEAKLKPYIEYKDKVDLETAKKLGIKDRHDEVEKFIKTNTQELAPDRWLCPLSGKKFKGPEFIRKHLFYKHMEKIVEVKKEVEYYNNYVMDPKRPQLPEHPSNKSGGSGGASSSSTGQSGSSSHQTSYQNQMGNQNILQGSPGLLGSPMMGGQMSYGGGMGRGMGGGWQSAPFMPDMMQSGYGGFNSGYGAQMGASGYQGYKKPGGYGSYGGRRPGKDSREMIQYRDLDAPEDS